MQDSQITFKFKGEGIEELRAQADKLGVALKNITRNVNGTYTASGRLATAQDTQAKSTNSAAAATDRASRAQKNYFGHIAKTTVMSALINQLFLQFIDISGQAIKQVDLMNNFPATMASMGESTEDATVAMDTLRNYVGQVGGNLGDATSMVTRFVGATGDVKAATAIFVGLNNALIAGDSTLEEQRQAAIQFAQALERGKPDMREWRTLTQNMSFQLTQVAKSMGYVNANDLGEALTNGKESMAEFTTQLTKLSTGTGPIAQQAIARMTGMQFSFNVLKNTMVQGLAAIINTIGRQNIVSFFTFLTQVVQVLTAVVLKLISALVTLFNFFGRLFGLPTIKLKADTAAVADNISSGADNAGDLADGLDDAGGAAKKLNKSLASFDKMNVLPDKESGSGGSGGKDAGAGGGGGFDPGQLGELGDLFGNIGSKLEGVSKWAKIFAGVLVGIAGIKFAQGIINQIDGIAKSFKTARNGMTALGKTIFGTTDETGKKVGGLPAIITGKFAGLGKFLANPYVIAAAAAVALVAGLVHLYKKNEDFKKGFDSVWNPILETLKTIAATIKETISIAIEALKKQWEELKPIIQPVLDLFNSIAEKIGLTGSLMELFGKYIAAGLGFLIASWLAPMAIMLAVTAAVVATIYTMWKVWTTVWNFMTTVFTKFWDMLVSTWDQLYDIFAGPIKWFLQFWQAMLLVIITIVAIAIESIFKLMVAFVTRIFNLFKTIFVFIYDYVIMPIYNIFAWLFNSIVGLAGGFVNGTKGVLSPIVAWIYRNVIDPIAWGFSSLWGGIKEGAYIIGTAFKSVLSPIVGIFRTTFNGVIDLINSVLRAMNKIKVPDWVPSVGGKGVNFPMIPRLARGGVVEQATLAVVGESGAEAVVPLENNLEWIDKLAAKINSSTGGSGQPIQLTVQIGEEKIASQIIDLINEKTQMSGRNTIYV